MPIKFRQALFLAAANLKRGLVAGEYKILLAALVVALGALSLIGQLNSRLDAAFSLRSAQLAGGDLIIEGAKPVSASAQAYLNSYSPSLAWSQQVQLSTLLHHAEAMVLTNLIGVDAKYPLLGAIQIQTSLEAENSEKIAMQQGPPVNEVWLEAGLAQQLEIELGAELEIGATNFLFSAVVTSLPTTQAGWANFTPKALVNLESLAASPLLGDLTRAHWQLGVLANSEQQADLMRNLPEYLSSEHKIQQLADQQAGITRVLQQARDYLAVIGIFGLVLACITLALACQRQNLRWARQAALLKTFGAKHKSVHLVFLLQLLALSLAAGFLANILAYGAQHFLGLFLAVHLKLDLPAPSSAPLWITQLAGILLLLVFMWLPLRGQLSPALVLQGQNASQNLSSKNTTAKWQLVVVAGLGLVGLSAWLINDWRLGVAAYIFIVVFSLGLAICGQLVLVLLASLAHKWPWYGRQAVRRLRANSASSLLQLVTLTWVLVVFLLVGRSSQQLMAQWLEQIPAQQPDYFALDVQPYEQAAFGQFLRENSSHSSQLYPLVGARLVQLNQQPIQQALNAKQRQDMSLHRELRLTFLSQLPPENQVLAGTWPPEFAPDAAIPISVEAGWAQRLGLQLGDKLGFQISGTLVPTQIASLRQVNWHSLQPNFFVIFPEQSLAEFTPSYLASFVMPKPEIEFIRQLRNEFPGVLLLDMRGLLQQLQSLVHSLGQLVSSLFVLLAAASFLVSWSLLVASQDARRRELALLRVFGAAQKNLTRAQLSEFFTLGALAGIFAALLSELGYALLAKNLLGLAWQPGWVYLLATPVAAGVFISLQAWWVLRFNNVAEFRLAS